MPAVTASWQDAYGYGRLQQSTLAASHIVVVAVDNPHPRIAQAIAGVLEHPELAGSHTPTPTYRTMTGLVEPIMGEDKKRVVSGTQPGAAFWLLLESIHAQSLMAVLLLRL